LPHLTLPDQDTPQFHHRQKHYFHHFLQREQLMLVCQNLQQNPKYLCRHLMQYLLRQLARQYQQMPH
jgi:hypothetical protein